MVGTPLMTSKDPYEHERRLHPSYRNKPLAAFQQVAMNSKLDDSANRQKIANVDVFHQPQPEAVPVTYDTVYDPSHPDADWAGMVSLRYQHKKHTHDHASQRMSIAQTEHGIVAKEERQEWGHKKQPEGASKNRSQFIIAGEVDPGADRFKTEYRRFAEHEGTQRDQLTLEKRMKSIKKIPDPAQARSIRDRCVPSELNSPYTGVGDDTPRSQQYYGEAAPSPYALTSPGLNGTSAYSMGTKVTPASLYAKKSFISDIAGSISAKVDLPPRAGSSTDAAFSHNRTLVTDNYKPFPGEDQLVPWAMPSGAMINVRVTAGYTGHRK